MRAKAAQIIEQDSRERRHLAAEWRREQVRRKSALASPATTSFRWRPFERLPEILLAKEDE